jgi:DNA ligase (NAD+)
MDIAGLGERVIEKLLETGKIKDIADIYTLDIEDLADLQLAGEKSSRILGEKAATSIIKSIESSRTRDPAALLSALGIRYVGSRVAEILSDSFGGVDGLESADENTLASVEGIGPRIAFSVAAFFRDPRNRKTIDKLRAAGVATRTGKKKVLDIDGSLKDLSFVFTGEMETRTRQEAESRVRQLGGATPSSVSRKTSFLVCGNNPGSKLSKAQSLGVKIIDEKAFLDMIGEGIND